MARGIGYDAYTSALYEQDTGAPPPKDHTNRYWMTWRRRQLTGLLRELRQRLNQESLSQRISLSPGPFRFAYNHWLQDWELWAVGELIDDLVVQKLRLFTARVCQRPESACSAQGPPMGPPRTNWRARRIRQTHNTDSSACREKTTQQ